MGSIREILGLLAVLSDSKGIQRCKILLMINDNIVSLGEEIQKLENERLALEEKVKDLESRANQNE